jgi:DNA-binding transcriptional regulator YdaS (Cro superfamily)
MTRPLSDLLTFRDLSMADLARLLGVNKSTVSRWSLRRVPAERVLDVERVSGVSRHALRPDLYPRDREVA